MVCRVWKTVLWCVQPRGENLWRKGPGDRRSRRKGQVQRSWTQLPYCQVSSSPTSSAQPQSQSTSGPKQLSSSQHEAPWCWRSWRKKSSICYPTQPTCYVCPVCYTKWWTSEAAREHCVEMHQKKQTFFFFGATDFTSDLFRSFCANTIFVFLSSLLCTVFTSALLTLSKVFKWSGCNIYHFFSLPLSN